MRKIGFLLAFSFFAPLSVAAGDYFKSCDSIKNLPEYKPLSTYLGAQKEPGAFCQRLNNSEFLYTDQSNIYYCKIPSGQSLECAGATASRWYPDVEISSTIYDSKGKQFVLLKSGRLSGGVYNEAYDVFNLVPKSVDPRGFKITSLQGAGESNGSSSDAQEVCSNMQGGDATEKTGDGFEIINSKSENSIIRFNQKITNCSDNVSATKKLDFMLIKGQFRLVQDLRVYEK